MINRKFNFLFRIYSRVKKGVVQITSIIEWGPSLFTVINVLVGWSVIAYFAIRIYQKQQVKIKVWKIILVIWIGCFSFSFNVEFYQTILKIPILPFGVWILYFFLKSKKGRWERYWRFAWLGFLGNFIFLAVTLMTIPLQSVLYPSDKISTYIESVDHAYIVKTYSSKNDVILQNELLVEQLPLMVQTEFFSDKWYEETYMNGDEIQSKERFPYQMVGVKGKWGSGIRSTFFIEEDGKGLLIATPKRQYYFRSDVSFLKGVKHE